MTSLEFIEKEIKSDEYFIKILIRDAQLGLKWENVDIEFFKKRIAHLKKIKSELEAWEIAKAKEIDILSVKTALDLEAFNIDLVKAYQLTEEEFNKLKKALEVE